MKTLRTSIVLALTLTSLAPAQERGDLLEQVGQVLGKSYYDKDYRRDELPALLEEYRAAAVAAGSLREERQLVHEFLARIPVSHLGLLSEEGYGKIFSELTGKPSTTLGCQLVELEGRYFVDWVFEGGPADRAGLLRGDRVLAIDGVHPAESERLDWRSDDAALPDPAIHALFCDDDDVVRFALERSPENRLEVTVEAAPYSGFEGMKYSARVLEVDGLRVGYVHLWYIQFAGPASFLKERMKGEFADCDALIVDLRGRGGSASEAMNIVNALDPAKGSWQKPVVALIDGGSRSAKEVISHELKKREAAVLVGERTAGAVIPATFKKVGSGTMLMYPSFTLGGYTTTIEGVGVSPDIEVEDRLPYAGGADPIFDAGLLAASAWCEVLAEAAAVGR